MKPIKCCSCGCEIEQAYYRMKLNRKNGEYNGTYNICIPCVWKIFRNKSARVPTIIVTDIEADKAESEE